MLQSAERRQNVKAAHQRRPAASDPAKQSSGRHLGTNLNEATATASSGQPPTGHQQYRQPYIETDWQVLRRPFMLTQQNLCAVQSSVRSHTVPRRQRNATQTNWRCQLVYTSRHGGTAGKDHDECHKNIARRLANDVLIEIFQLGHARLRSSAKNTTLLATPVR